MDRRARSCPRTRPNEVFLAEDLKVLLCRIFVNWCLVAPFSSRSLVLARLSSSFYACRTDAWRETIVTADFSTAVSSRFDHLDTRNLRSLGIIYLSHTASLIQRFHLLSLVRPGATLPVALCSSAVMGRALGVALLRLVHTPRTAAHHPESFVATCDDDTV